MIDLKEIANALAAKANECCHRSDGYEEDLQRAILAALEAAWNARVPAQSAGGGEPVAEIVSMHGDPEAFGERELVALIDIQKFPYHTKLYARAVLTDTAREGEYERGWKAAQEACAEVADRWHGELDERGQRRSSGGAAIRALEPTAPSNVGTGEG